mmetsp:Transcript_26266/g.37647  ORF Transcript_26266/g.37647 Transcript_26266/m.37647 type:complete len:86 (+) Transcript_26266:107-364(+)
MPLVAFSHSNQSAASLVMLRLILNGLELTRLFEDTFRKITNVRLDDLGQVDAGNNLHSKGQEDFVAFFIYLSHPKNFCSIFFIIF